MLSLFCQLLGLLGVVLLTQVARFQLSERGFDGLTVGQLPLDHRVVGWGLRLSSFVLGCLFAFGLFAFLRLGFVFAFNLLLSLLVVGAGVSSTCPSSASSAAARLSKVMS